MDVRVDRGDEDIGNKVVLHTRVHLDNVPPLHIQIVDGNSLEILGPATDSESVTPVRVCVCLCVCVCVCVCTYVCVVVEITPTLDNDITCYLLANI